MTYLQTDRFTEGRFAELIDRCAIGTIVFENGKVAYSRMAFNDDQCG